MTEEDLLKDLNSSQRKAVLHKNGPCLIVAGAGTGKTSVITRKIAYIISKKWAKPSEILALTFTDKAASEMEARVDTLVPYGYTDTWISTFHAFGDRVLRDFALEVGLPANFKVLSQTEQAVFIRQNLFAFDLNYFRPTSNPTGHISELISHFSHLKDELVSPEKYLEFARKKLTSKLDDEQKEEAKRTLELANAYNTYCELMEQNGNLDYGDQIYRTHKLLKENKKVLSFYQNQFKYILVDEYQDTNFAQNEIVKLLAQKSKNITVVGDDDQSIYRFRGASISNILDFKKSYPKLTQIVLNQNYRSSQEILDASYRLIQNNNPDRLEVKNKINKKLVGQFRSNLPDLIFCESLSCEADSVIAKINELSKQKKFKLNDFAILVRANSHAEPFIQSLNVNGIPYIFSGSQSLFSKNEIKMLVSFLRCLVYQDDSLAFYFLASSEIYAISHETLTKIFTVAKRTNRSSIEVAKNFEVPKVDEKKLKELLFDIESFRQHNNEPVGEVLYEYLNKKNYLRNLLKNLDVENELKLYNVAKFFDRIAQFNHSSQDRGVISFLQDLELILEVGDSIATSDIDPDIKAVNILTVHSAKGLEWPVVFLVNCVNDRFPTRQKHEQLPIPEGLIKERLPEGNFHLQEERRLFYVGATRAKQYLFLSAGEDYGGKRVKKLSQFAMELLGEASSLKLTKRLTNKEKIDRFRKIEMKNQPVNRKNDQKVLRLSRQQIDDYETCPRKYYFSNVVKIPLPSSQQFMYGNAIHAALDHYFSRIINKQKPKLQSLLEDFEIAFKNEGFITREQEEQRRKQGIETLKRFFKEQQLNPTKPTSVEEVFEFTLDDVKVNGRFDLVAKAGDKTEILDFKTSDLREQKKADERLSKSIQMKIYALAWQKKYGTIAKTTLHFIEPNLIASREFKPKDLEKVEQIILNASRGIRKADFGPNPDTYQCRGCPYRDICPDSLA